jgi:hypothetical protein
MVFMALNQVTDISIQNSTNPNYLSDKTPSLWIFSCDQPVRAIAAATLVWVERAAEAFLSGLIAICLISIPQIPTHKPVILSPL